MTNPASNMDVKRLNRTNTLRCILSCDRISQLELTQRLNLSWPTVLQNVKELIAMGLIQEAGTYESTGGRKARAYAPVGNARLAVGLDLTQNHVGAVLVNLCGQIVRYTRRSCPFSPDDGYFQNLSDLLRDFIGDSDTRGNILSVGISLPGIVDGKGERLLHPHALGDCNVPIAPFSRFIPYPCRFINDANAAGLAEVYGRPSSGNLVYLSLSNSVGGAILIDGKLYSGSSMCAGEFGHNTLVPGGLPCYCGKRGCLNAYCSARVLSSHAEDSLPAFFDRLRKGDPFLGKIWEEYLGYLAVEINNLHMSFDCNVIAGGYVGAFLEEFGAPLRKLLEDRNTFGKDASYFRVCRYKLEASAMGAALMQIEAFLRQL